MIISSNVIHISFSLNAPRNPCFADRSLNVVHPYHPLRYKRIILLSSMPLKLIASLLLWAVATCHSKDVQLIMCELLKHMNEFSIQTRLWLIWILSHRLVSFLSLQGTKTMSFLFWGQLAAGHIICHGNCLLRLGSGCLGEVGEVVA